MFELLNKERHENLFHAFFIILLTAASAARLYHLETPSLWYDEILLPISVSTPWTYFYDWLVRLEVHPPLPYLLVKGMLLAGNSDFALRLPFTLAGIASFYAIYRVAREHFGSPAALTAAAFLAASQLHLYLSMSVRPYTFIIVAMELLIHSLLLFQSTQSNKHVCWAAAFNSAIFSFHYIGIFLFFSTSIVLALSCRDKKHFLKIVFLFSAFSLVLSAPTIYFFLQTLAHRASGSFAFPLSFYATKYISSVTSIFNFSTLPGHAYQPMLFLFAYVFPALCLMGLLASIIRRKRHCIIWLSFLIVPFAMIVVLRFHLQVTPWHLSFLLPVFAFLAAIGTSVLPAPRLLPVLVALVSAWSLLAFMQCEPCHDEYAYGGTAKSTARWLTPGHVGENRAVIAEEMSFHSVNWYLNQYMAANPAIRQRITADRQYVDCTYLLDSKGTLGHFITKASDISRLGSDVAPHASEGWQAVTTRVVKQNRHIMLGFPYRFSLPADPAFYYSHVDASDDIIFFPMWGKGWMPSRNDSAGRIEFYFENDMPREKALITLAHKYHISGVGNIIATSIKFDDEPWIPLHSLDSMPPKTTTEDFPMAEAGAFHQRLKPFSALRVAYELTSALITPRYDGGNLNTTVLNGFTLSLDPITQDMFSADGKLDRRAIPVGFGGVERDGSLAWRWASGPESGFILDLDEAAPVRLDYAFHNYIPGQTVTVSVNGRTVKEHHDLARAKWLDESVNDMIAFQGVKGRNTITFSYTKWNGNPEQYLSESSANSAAFTRLRLAY